MNKRKNSLINTPVNTAQDKSNSTLAGNAEMEPISVAVSAQEDRNAVREPSLVSQSTLGIELTAELQGKYGLDPFFKAILDKPSEYRNFTVTDWVIYLKEHEKQALCIPKVVIQGRSAREIVISEAHSMLAHL